MGRDSPINAEGKNTAKRQSVPATVEIFSTVSTSCNILPARALDTLADEAQKAPTSNRVVQLNIAPLPRREVRSTRSREDLLFLRPEAIWRGILTRRRTRSKLASTTRFQARLQIPTC